VVSETATSSYGALITERQTNAFGQTGLEVFGDVAGTFASLDVDNEGRLISYDLERGTGPWADYVTGGPPSPTDFTLQSILAEQTLTYDMVGNPVSITQSSFSAQSGGGDDGDGENPGTLNEWPRGGLPTLSRTMTYWDDYRLKAFSVSYQSPESDDTAGLTGNPYTAAELAAATYPALGPVSTGNRVRSQTFGYDLRGNVLTSTDDANDLWDRSLGPVTYVPGSDQLATTGAGGTATCDAAGNVATLTTATGSTFELLFDEVGRLTTAVREDGSGTIVSERYTYDAGGERVLTDETPAFSAPDRYTVNVFDSLVLKGATFPDANGDYQHDDSTENVYFNAGGLAMGHAFYAPELPSATGPVHVFLRAVKRPGKARSFWGNRGSLSAEFGVAVERL
jgi:YD repeat-containing protein